VARFDELRDELAGWRAESEKLRTDLLAAREDVKRGLKNRADDVERFEGIQRELRASGRSLWAEFRPFVDPKETLRRLEDRYPILLFPLRIETRFNPAWRASPNFGCASTLTSAWSIHSNPRSPNRK
jgi:hypothetical protein